MSEQQRLSHSAGELAQLVRSGRVSPVEVVDASLGRIEEINPQLNAFAAIYAEDARREAKMAEAAVRSGAVLGPLHGIPIAMKDMTPIKGRRTTLGSRAYENNVASEDAWIVKALRRAQARSARRKA